MSGTAAIEPEGELVEVGLEVLGPQAVIDAETQVFRLEKTRWMAGVTTWAAMDSIVWGSWVTPGAPR